MKFTLDGKTYDVVVERLTRKGVVTDGKNAFTVLSGRKVRDVVGTYYSYGMTIVTSHLSTSAYDALYEVLTAPQNEPHTVTFPYGQTTLTFFAYINTVTDKMTAQTPAETVWGDLTVTFEAERPQRR